jgi:hypothetical protein
MASLFSDGKFQGFDSSGNPLSAGKLCSYAAGTLTPLATYTTQAGDVANAVEVTLDSAGRASVWLGAVSYRMILKNSAGTTIWDVDNISPAESDSTIFLASGSGAVARTTQAKLRETVSAEDFAGVDPTGAADSTTGIVAAIAALRLYSASRLDTIGGNTITMYRSGTLNFGPGVFKITANTLQIVADMGLTFKGAGSRRFTNAIYGRTTLLITGTSSGYGISLYRNGARSVHFEDLDICYETSGFTGHLVDAIDAPATKFKNCYLGTYGITGGTRLQTAASLLRITYDEDVTLEDCTLDGAVLGVYSDDTRTELANTFGGWGLVLNRCTFYDFTGTMVSHGGTRTRTTVSLIDCHFNPINVDCVRAVDLNNVDGLVMQGCILTPSTTAKASTEWMRLVNVTGQISGNSFNDLSKAGTLNGFLDLTGNICAGTDGFTLTGGTVRAVANEFSTGTRGWDIAPTEALCLVLGPDKFKSPVTNSYRIAADSAFLSGAIQYDSALDGSSGGFSNASGRVKISAVDEKMYSISALTYTLLKADTGRTARATGAAGQVFTLPAPTHGTRHRVFKASAQTLQITCGSAILYAGVGAIKTSASAAAPDVGGWIEFQAYDSSGWIITAISGTWTIA